MLDFIYHLIIKPLQLIMEVVFHYAYQHLHGPVPALAAVSLAVSLLSMPLYRRADAVQEEERKRQKEMEPWIRHIRAAFQGDERYMILSAYYKEKGYHPLYALRSSFSLLLQIPFFIAAYRCILELSVLSGQSFGPIRDLGAPDGLLNIGGLQINLLPILMTVINLASGVIYTKGFSLRDKLQTYGIALVFLVLLYSSPSGLVIYWTCNNIFSLIRNLLKYLLPERAAKEAKEKKADAGNSLFLFLAGALCCSLLTGVLIPTASVSSAPFDFYSVVGSEGVLSLLWNTAAMGLGFFLIWGGLIYYLLPVDKKNAGALFLCFLSLAMLLNYMVFVPPKEAGTLSAALVYEHDFARTLTDVLVNLLALAALGGLVFLFRKRVLKWGAPALGILSLAILSMSVLNLQVIGGELDQIVKSETEEENPDKLFTFSRTGKNVVVIMLDRAISAFVPYMFAEKPELYESFDGFTWYPNTVSFAGHTVTAAPALFGGYEYTPDRMQARKGEKMRDKQTEAYSVLPLLFSRAGYETVACDLPYLGYQIISDPTVLRGYPGVSAYNTIGKYESPLYSQVQPFLRKKLNRNLFLYAIFRVTPGGAQSFVYNGGKYHDPDTLISGDVTDLDTFGNFSDMTGIADISDMDPEFESSYSVLIRLSELTEFDEEGETTPHFIELVNDTTHGPGILQMPDYEPAMIVDNSGFETGRREDEEGNVLDLSDPKLEKHYHTNMAAFLKLGEWLDYLKENGAYDNTKIIIASDHGYGINYVGKWKDYDLSYLNPLFMVKDFGETGKLKTSREFMTNADAPAIALEGNIDDPRNPATGEPMANGDKSKCYATTSGTIFEYQDPESDVYNLGDSPWLSVHDDLFDIKNWAEEDPPE